MERERASSYCCYSFYKISGDLMGSFIFQRRKKITHSFGRNGQKRVGVQNDSESPPPPRLRRALFAERSKVLSHECSAGVRLQIFLKVGGTL